MENQLLKIYTQIFASKKNEPEWAMHKATAGHTQELIHCPIPFVGKEYARQKVKILLYASAENLTGYDGYLDDDQYAIHRHRNFFERSTSNPDTFFPNVHIQPINDGCLPIVALYLYLQFHTIDEIMPAEFLERISLANYCKYTIQSSSQNQDYATNKDYLEHSHEYIKADIETLNPDYIIIPKMIYWTDCEFIDKIKGNAKAIPIYQMNARNINLRIKKHPQKDLAELPPFLCQWYNRLEANGIKGKTKENFLSVFSYLDEVFQEYLR